MTNEQEINIAIAEACGWENVHKPGFPGLSLGLPPKGCSLKADQFPNYYGKHYEIPYFCRDLNAMHEAEGTLTKQQQEEYDYQLSEITAPITGERWSLLHATARQRAEAFLRTLEKWKEEA